MRSECPISKSTSKISFLFFSFVYCFLSCSSRYTSIYTHLFTSFYQYYLFLYKNLEQQSSFFRCPLFTYFFFLGMYVTCILHIYYIYMKTLVDCAFFFNILRFCFLKTVVVYTFIFFFYDFIYIYIYLYVCMYTLLYLICMYVFSCFFVSLLFYLMQNTYTHRYINIQREISMNMIYIDMHM